jgi:hypothetical protein
VMALRGASKVPEPLPMLAVTTTPAPAAPSASFTVILGSRLGALAS